MTDGDGWYRSAQPPPRVARTWRRRMRDAARGLLPEPDVRGQILVMRSRRTLPKLTRTGLRSEYHGLFSEFHSVLGALIYAREHGGAGVRVAFDSPLYVDARYGSNWWSYFFEHDTMRVDDGASNAPELTLDGIVTKYGRYGGFSDVVQGATPYLYPMTFGVDRHTLHALVASDAMVRPEIADEVQALARAQFEPGAFVVGVHYRGTDAVHRWAGPLRHYRTTAVPYESYVDEVRRVLAAAAPRTFQVFVATDESAFVEAARRAFPGRVTLLDSPRAGSDGRPVHLTAGAVSPYEKGKSAMLDALLLASTNHLVKGRSNLSDASLIFNPDLPYSFCPDVEVYGLPGRMM
jgi:hypothetical protein